jgi:TolB-like protein
VHWLLVAAALASQSEPAQERQKLLILDVRAVEIEKEQADTLTAFITARAARFESLDVVSAAELRDLADLQAEKLRAGCDDDAQACIAELAGALGAQYVLTSRAGKLEGVFVVTASLFDAKTGTAQGRASVEAWSLAEVPQKLGPQLDEILEKATGTKPKSDVVAEAPKKEGLDPAVINAMRIGGGVTAVVGVGLFTLGAIPGFTYNQKKQDLIIKTAEFTGDPAQLDEAERIHADAVAARDLYNSIGVWGVATGVVMVLVGGGAVAASFFVPVAE